MSLPPSVMPVPPTPTILPMVMTTAVTRPSLASIIRLATWPMSWPSSPRTVLPTRDLESIWSPDGFGDGIDCGFTVCGDADGGVGVDCGVDESGIAGCAVGEPEGVDGVAPCCCAHEPPAGDRVNAKTAPNTIHLMVSPVLGMHPP